MTLRSSPMPKVAMRALQLSPPTVARNGNLSAITTGVGDTQTAACWVAVTHNGTFAFTSNTGSGTVLSYTVSDTGRARATHSGSSERQCTRRSRTKS